MRISDWSSDVCSSDLLGDAVLFQAKDFADFPIGLPLVNEYDAIALAVCEVNGTAARGTTPTADLPSGIERESSDQLRSKSVFGRDGAIICAGAGAGSVDRQSGVQVKGVSVGVE